MKYELEIYVTGRGKRNGETNRDELVNNIHTALIGESRIGLGEYRVTIERVGSVEAAKTRAAGRDIVASVETVEP